MLRAKLGTEAGPRGTLAASAARGGSPGPSGPWAPERHALSSSGFGRGTLRTGLALGFLKELRSGEGGSLPGRAAGAVVENIRSLWPAAHPPSASQHPQSKIRLLRVAELSKASSTASCPSSVTGVRCSRVLLDQCGLLPAVDLVHSWHLFVFVRFMY